MNTSVRHAFRSRRALALWLLAFACLFVLLYGVQGNAQEVHRHGRSAIVWMAKRWNGSGGDLSHGWLIPLVSGWILWRGRRELAAARRAPCTPAIVLVALSLALHWAGVRSQLTRLSLFSMVLLLWSVPLYLYGWNLARRIAFPCAYLLYCIPFTFLDHLTVPLRLAASRMATGLLNGIGMAAVRTGTAIRSLAPGEFHIDVVDPCSGLRSLLAMSALTAAYAYFTRTTLARKWILFLSAVPLAIIGNVARIVTIAWVARRFGPERAMQVYHDYSTYIIFAVAVVLMTGWDRMLRNWNWRRITTWTCPLHRGTTRPS